MNEASNEFQDLSNQEPIGTTTSMVSMVIVPLEKLSDEALDGLINEFILREGTDYGKNEYSLEQKHEQVKKQLDTKHVLVVFDTKEESCSLVRKESLPKALRLEMSHD